MTTKRVPSRWVCCTLFLIGAVILGIGCQKKPTLAALDSTPVIPVSHAVERLVTDYMDYTGRTDAVLAVNVRARATGYLLQTRFEEGAEVKEGDLLFQIDPQPYDIQVEQAKAQIVQAKASLKNAEATLAADKQAQMAKAVSDLQIIADEANVEAAVGRLDAAKATLKNAELNLSFTKVYAQISGQISRYYYTPGNLITQDQTLLTTIVSTDHMYAYFDIETQTLDRIVQEISKKKNLNLTPIDPQAIRSIAGGMSGLTPIQLTSFPVLMAVEGQTGFPYRGKLDFINNQVNPSTGTVAVRGYFENKHLKDGLVPLTAGRFVRVRLPLGGSHKSQLVIDRAIGSDQGIKFVYVLDSENRVQNRRVVTGPLQEDGLRVIEPYAKTKNATGDEIETGVKPEEWVVVGGLQQLKPRLQIKPEEMDMPTITTDPMAPQKGSAPGPGEKGEKGEKGGKKGGGKK